jgi:hypothetical protein
MRILKIFFCLFTVVAIGSWQGKSKFRSVSLYRNIFWDVPVTLKRVSSRELSNYQILNRVRFKNKSNKASLLIDVFDTSYNDNQSVDKSFIEYFKETLKTKQNPSVEFLTTNIKSEQDISIGYFTYSFMGSKEKHYGAQAYIKCLNRELLHVEYTCPWPDSNECGEIMQKMIASVKYK